MVHRVATTGPTTMEGRPRSGVTALTLPVSRDGLRLTSLVLICFADTARLGDFDPLALALVFASLALMLLSLHAPRTDVVPAPMWEVAVVALLLMMLQFPNNFASEFDPGVFKPLTAVAVAAALGVMLFRTRRRAAVWLLGLVGLAQVAMMAVSMGRTWGAATIDVFKVQQQAAGALIHGANPYTPLIDQLVGDGINPSRLVPGHFPYGPSIPLLDAPARALGDIRLTHLAAFALLLVVLTTLARRGARGRELFIALLWLAFPLTAGMVEKAWIDIITMAGFGGWLALRSRHPWWAAATLAVALAAKPIFLPALIPVFLWSRAGRRETLLAAGMALLIILPFAIVTGFRQFYDDVVQNHLNGEARYDSLTFTSFLHAAGHPPLPVVVALAVIVVVSAAAVARRPRDQGDLLTSGAIICTIAFLMVKMAYFNYYFIPAVLLIMALATRQLQVDEAEAPADLVHASAQHGTG